MLNRRQLRVKVLQTLYAYYNSENRQVKDYEKALLKSVESVWEMYLTLLNLLVEVADYSALDAEERANKFLPTAADLNASTKLKNNLMIAAIRQHPDFIAGVKKFKIDLSFDPELPRVIFSLLKTSEAYGNYLQQDQHDINEDKDIIKHIFRQIILKSAGVEQVFEERFMNWPVDREVLQALVAKTLKNFVSADVHKLQFPELTPNWAEDRDFILDLLARTISFEEPYLELIASKTRNWEAERIAMMDTLIMRMAIAELVHFPQIPVKVTINEYLEIAKDYSTPKSNLFINGILDKILAQLKTEGKIRKSGRGLIE